MAEYPIIKVGLSYKKNMGNYETLGIDLGVEDFPRNGENARQAFDRVYGFVESLVLEKLRETEEELKQVTEG